MNIIQYIFIERGFFMKKLDTESLEKMAKQKNIDKDKIEKMADSYKGKSENELMEELIKIGKNLDGRDEVVSKFKAFLDENQRKKLDNIMEKLRRLNLLKVSQIHLYQKIHQVVNKKNLKVYLRKLKSLTLMNR